MIGSRLGPYEITAKLGEGGMGEVYQAKDFHLGRNVALKVLPEGFTNDPERLQRFEREAKLLAQLNHPNIAQIYGFETSGDTRALVMELVEGPTLADRLEQGPFPFKESLSVSLQIAHALEEAHEKGIVHRDLKPQNIKASVEGKVKVLDFGLAKAMDPTGTASGSPTASQLAMSPTMTLGATVQGMILGTAAYMAPEQARGMTVDRRADIWAFGVVLYEMLTGESPFLAETVPDTLARVLTRELDLSKLPPEVPPAIRRLVRRCVARLPKDRLHAIADARIVIEDVLSGRMEEPVSAAVVVAPAAAERSGPTRFVWRALPWLGGATAGLLLAALLRPAATMPVPSAASASMRTLVAAGFSEAPSVSPDGRTLAFRSERDGAAGIWIKDLTSDSESLLVARASHDPAISPDGTSVLFTAEAPEGGAKQPDLYRISLATREERLVARDGIAGVWSPDGRSVAFLRGFAKSGSTELVSVELESGRERSLYRDSEPRLVAARWSPDGRRISLMRRAVQAGESDRIALFELASGKSTELSLDAANRVGTQVRGFAWYSPRRMALLLLDSADLMTASGRIALFDVESGEVRSLLPIANVGWGLAVAGPGALIAGVGSTEQNLYEARRDQRGRWSEPTLETEGPFRDRQPVYSPDGRWLLFTSNRSGNLDIWRQDRASGELRRLTDHEATDWDPALTPDGSHLLFSSDRTGKFQIWMAEADGSSPQRLTDLENAQNPTMTADGEWIVFVLQDAGADRNGIWKVRPDGSEPTLVALGAYLFPETSPDGGHVAAGDVTSTTARVLRLADGAKLDAEPADTVRYRWSVETGGNYLWAIVYESEVVSIRRFPFDAASGRIGAGEVMLAGADVRSAETIGVARDGSAVAFSSIANERGQLIRIDGIEGLEERP